MMLSNRHTLAAVVVAAAIAGVSRADQLQIEGLPPQPVTITGFKDNKIIYQTQRGDQNDRDYDRIKQLTVDGETAFNAAEDAFAKGNKEASIDNYAKAIRGSGKPWEKAFAARRMLDALGNSKRFDAQVAAYLALLVTDPTQAAAHKPALPEKGSTYLDKASADIDEVLKTPGLTDAQQLALLNFQIEVQRQRGNEGGVTSALERMTKLGGDAGKDPAVQAQLATLKVNQARLALDQKNYAQAKKLIDDNRQFISDPRAQSDALYILAQCAEATADKTDKNAMKDAALAYMRVVANFDDLEGKPNVLPSMQATANILEQIGEKNAATTVLGQIADEFPQDPAAAAAKTKIEQLKKG